MQVSEQVRRNCILVKILDQSELVAVSTKIFRNFFFGKNFAFFSWTTKYSICMFWCKNADVVFRPKFLTSRTKGHFLWNFACFFFFFFLTWQHCILVEILNQSELAAFLYKIYKTSSSFEWVSHFILGPLNMLSVCFGAKTPTLYSG